MVAIGHRQRRRVLILANVLLAAGTVAVLAAVALLPLEASQASTPPPARTPTQPSQPAPKRQPLSSHAAIWGVDLNRPLFDPPPPASAPVQPPTLNIQLAGTALEEGSACAFFRTPEGAVKMVAVGQTIAGAELIEVTQEAATLRVGGRLVTLKSAKDKEAKP